MPSPRFLFRLIPLGLILCVSAAYAIPSARPAREIAPSALRGARIGHPERQQALTRSAAWQEFVSRNGRWTVLWNEITGTPHRAFGKGIRLDGFRGDAGSVDLAVRRFVEANPALFGPAPTLETLATHRTDRLWYVRMRQTVRNVPVLFEDWEFRVSADGRLVAFGADRHRVPDDVDTTPLIVGAVAREAARAGIDFDPATDRVEGGTDLYLLPYHTGTGVEYRLVYEVRVRTQRPPGNWITLVDADNGEVLSRRNHVFYASGHAPGSEGFSRSTVHVDAARSAARAGASTITAPMANITGHVTGKVHPTLPTSTLTSKPFANLTVNVGAEQGVTDATGQYSALCTGTSTVTAGLAGSFVVVNRLDVIDGDASYLNGGVSCPSTRDIFWDGSNSQDSERDAFYHVNLAHDYVKGLDPAYTGNDNQQLIGVNSIDDECSAFYDGLRIIFGLEGLLGCANMATLPDIIYQLYGQRVTDNLYFQEGAAFGLENRALHQGLGDVFAAFILDDPVIGDGVEGPGTSYRDISSGHRWPEDQSADATEQGLILAGAFWDLRLSAGLAVAEQLAHFSKYGLADDPDDGVAMSEYFIETLVADDDDADITNGTPHFTEILDAFNAHGIGTNFFLTINHTALDDQPTGGPYPISAVIQYTGPVGALETGSPTLYYQVSGLPYASELMLPTGNPDEYGAEVPGQSGAIVRYYITATESNGGMQVEPGGAPTRNENLFIAGPASAIIANDMESDPGWTVGAVDDNAITGIWVRDVPMPTIAQTGVDHTPTGTQCWVTGNAPDSLGPGENDVDDGKTTLLTGIFDATLGGFITYPIVSYFRWYSNNAGEAPNADTWQVDISNDGGQSWVNVENTTDTEQSWRRVIFFINDYVTPTNNMQMRFVASDLGLPSLIEAAVDDWTLGGYIDPVSVEPTQAARPLALAPAAPNPFQGQTRLRYTLPAGGRVELGVYDIGGRLIRSLVASDQEAGAHTVAWDGRDGSGRPVASGPYFIRLSQRGVRSTQAVVRIR